MNRVIQIFDTTLRDGEQAPGFSMNIAEKLEMAKQLEILGVDIIEAGFAISSNEDFEAVKVIAETLKKASVCSLSRLVKKDIESSFEAVKDAARGRIHAFIATSDIHMKYKLKMTKDEVLAAVKENIRYAANLCQDIQFSAEDAIRSDPAFLAEVFSVAIESGASVINMPDTVGYTTPSEISQLVTYLKNHVRGIENAVLAVHCHNDLGMAVSNTLAGVAAGATQVECTVSGIGERAGNAALEEIVMALHTRKDYFGIDTKINTRQIYRACKLLSTITGVPIHPNKPIVGANAFAHESGIHQHGVMSEQTTYEIMTPESVGVYRSNMVLGKHSGKHAFAERLKELGYHLSPEEISKLFVDFKELTNKKRTISDQDLEALVGFEQIREYEIFSLESYSVQTGTNFSATSAVKLSQNGEIFEDASLGDGPIDAAFQAINRITQAGATLINYAIQSVSEGEDALGEVVVKLEDANGVSVTGRGLSTDIIEASIKAYLNGVNKLLAKDSPQRAVSPAAAAAGASS